MNLNGQRQDECKCTRVVAAFDFDKTITKCDTFVRFLLYAFGRRKVFFAIVCLIPNFFKFFLNIISRDDLKKSVVLNLFAGQSVAVLSELGKNYSRVVSKWIRPEALDKIRWHKSCGHRLIIVSASLDIYLQFVFSDLGFDDLLCTQLEFHDGYYTGAVLMDNCRASEKVKRLHELLGDLSKVEIYAYGDSSGDYEMLRISNHPFYRIF